MRFVKDLHFLSCFSFSPMVINGIHYASAVAAFQSFKTLDKAYRKARFENTESFDAYHAGHRLQLRPDWKEIREDILLRILRKKFSVPELREKLIAVDGKIIAENRKFDKFWGVDARTGIGKNKLGEMLMMLRDECRNASPSPTA